MSYSKTLSRWKAGTIIGDRPLCCVCSGAGSVPDVVMTLNELLDNFELLGSWEDRYKYVIDLGKALPPMPEEYKTDENKVRGCMSQVWFKFMPSKALPPQIEFLADSDAFIVKGLAAILHLIYSGKTKEEASEINLDEVFKKLGLESHLSMNRRSGFYAMAERIRSTIGPLQQ